MKKIFYWLYLAFCYIIPCGLLFYTFVVENIANKNVSVMAKLGASGIFALTVCIIVGIIVVNKIFANKEKKYEKLSIKEVDLQKREEYINKWNKIEKYHNIFKQCLMLAVIITITLLVALLESKLLALRGTMITMSILFGIGVVFFSLNENAKETKKE